MWCGQRSPSDRVATVALVTTVEGSAATLALAQPSPVGAAVLRALWHWLWVAVAFALGSMTSSLILTGTPDLVLAGYAVLTFLWWPAVVGVLLVVAASAVVRRALPAWLHVVIPVLTAGAWSWAATTDLAWTAQLVAPVLLSASGTALGEGRGGVRARTAVTALGVVLGAAALCLAAVRG